MTLKCLKLLERHTEKVNIQDQRLKKSDFSGVEYFTFKALKKGEAKITFTYQKVGEEEVIKQKIFTILIK